MNATNNYRYAGNYDAVYNRESGHCLKCNSTQNLDVHHLDGYSSEHPENSEVNKMAMLCRSCHKRQHASTSFIGFLSMMKIGYYNLIDEMPSSFIPFEKIDCSYSIYDTKDKNIFGKSP